MENKNLLNLLKWVLKKGPSETKKYQADSKKEQAWSEREPADSKKEQALEEKDQVKGTKLVKRTKLGMEGASLRNIFRYAAMVTLLLTLACGNAWGATFTPAQIAASGGTTTNNIKVSTDLSAGTAKKCSTQSGVAAISLSSAANANVNSNYIEIQATSGTITSLSLQARGNGDGNTGAMVIVFWSGDAQATYSSYSTSFNYLDRAGTYCDDAGYIEISVPSNTKTVRLYKKIYVKDGAISNASGKTTVEAGGTYNIFGISALSSTSCMAADLTAANITSNGDQVVGTGITFSKVGSPASGDTWYWQTSATGTDKTYNASSSYTTATTAGSYTVYLRAYNTASDCWGTAISKTNTIFCSNVYNGENVAKGSTTASDWTIYSSSSMALTSGSSNGYSYWYQAASGSSDYVQFDGSASLVSGDKIIIRWTHTNGSDKTLSLTINGSGASLTSGNTAKNSVLTEAVYDVTSTTSVTSIKLNSSSSKGCIIYQVSIVKADCEPEPSCGETAQAALTLSSNSGTICGTGTVTFTVSGGSGSGALSVASSDETKATASIDGSTVTVTGVAAGSATITVTKACDATYAEKTATYSVTVADAPTANAGADKTTEPGEGVALAATAAASGCTGAWTIQSGPNTSTSQLSSTTSATATFTPTVAGTYTLRWTVTNTSTTCSAYDEMKVTAAICSISECGNATITYAINASTDVTNTAANLLSANPDVSNTTALGTPVAASAVALSTIEISSESNKGKAAANTSACYPTAPTMSSKIGMYNGSSYSASNYLQFAFTVKTGYTFTPCDIQFTVQPVSNVGNFRWEVTDGTNVYGYGTATDVPKGSDGGASVLTGLTSTEEMEAGDYYLRLYPYYNGSNTFRISNNVILKGTTASAAPSCTAPNHVDVTGNYRFTPGETISLTAAAYSSEGTGSPITSGITYQWQKYNGSTWDDMTNGGNISGATSDNLQISSCTTSNGGSYRCKASTGSGCDKYSDDGKDAHFIRIWTFNGNYNDEGFIANNITWTGTNTGTVTLTLNANSTYKFKVFDNDGKWFGCNSGITADATNWTFRTNEGNCSLTTGKVAGEYTFTIDIASAGDNNITVSVAYPMMRIYMECGSNGWCNDNPVFFAHSWKGGTSHNAMMTAHLCESGLYYADIPSYDTDLKFTRQKPGSTEIVWNGANFWNQSENITIGSNNKFTNTGWNTTPEPDEGTFSGSSYSPTTYTITFASNGSDGGSAMSNVTSIPCGEDRTLVANTWTKTGHTFAGWKTNVAITANSSAVAADGIVANQATINNINQNITLTAQWTPNNYDLTWNLGGGTTTSAGTGIASGVSVNTTTSQAYGTALTAPTVTKTGYNFSSWSPSVASTMPAANTTYTATWTAKTTTITIDANTGNHGSTTPGSVTATYGSALPSFTAAAGVSGWNLTGYFTAPTSGTKVINANGTLVASTDYADGSGNWKYETATLTLYPQYEEEGCTPTTASITFNNNVAGKFNTNWSASDITTSGGATYTLTNTSCDTGHKMTKQAIKGAKNSTLIQINIPAGATSGTISVSAATYEGGAATLAITNSGGSVLASQSLSGTTTNPDAGSWSAPTLKTASYNITSGGTYYIKETSNSNNIYIYAFSATGTIPCCNATPDAPTSPSNGATGSTTQAVSWTDAGNDKWEVYVSTSSSTPGGSQTPTASPTTASYTFEDLTASTQYYWWVRSVCDADHKSSWVAGTSFTTSAPAVLTAMECNTLYKVGDMVPSGYTLTSDEQYGAGLSANTYFETLGDPSKTSSAGGAPEMKNISSVTIDGTSFGAAMYLKRAAEISSSLPTSHAVKFIVSESAKLIMYVKRSDRLYLIKEGGSAQSLGSSDSNEKVEKDVTAGTYYIYANNTNTVVYGLNLQCCTTPADPDGLAAGSITGTTATFTITDDETPASYDIYYSTSSTAPTSETAATTTTTTTSKLVEGLTPNTTYYAWVRAVCDASHKSGWVALTGSTFTTSAAGYTVTYDGSGAGGGAVPVDGSSPYTSGSTVTVLGNTGSLTRTIGGSAATFYGWNTNSTGYGGTHYEAGNTFSISANTTLYAEWGFPITYNTDDGTINDLSYPTHYIYTGSDDCTTAALPTNVTKDGYTFDGWYTANGSGSRVTCIEGTYTGAFAGDYALKAKWTEKTDCEEVFAGQATNTTTFSASVGSATTNIGSGGDSFSAGGYSYSVKPNSTDAIVATPKAGKSFAAGDSVIFVVYNNNSGAKKMGFKLKSTGEVSTSVAGKALHTFRVVLAAGDIESGNVKFNRQSSDDRWVEIIIKKCGLLPTCTTPVIPSLSNQTVCPGSDIAAWNATQTASLAGGETAAYSWKKKGSETVLATTASFDLGASATEGQAGTYVVTVTVSALGKASSSASAEVDLTVTPATETPVVTASKAKVYAGDEVVFSATCGSTGVTWQWYRCTNAGGTITGSCLSTTSSYTLASAPAAGTYYYKAVATGDGTNSCGAAEYVYTLVVSAADACDKEFWFAKEADRPTGAAAATHITGCPSGSSSASYTASIDGTNYTLTGSTGQKTGNVTIVVPADNTGTLYVVVQGSSSRTITLSKGGTQIGQETPANSTWGVFTFDNLDAGTYTLVSSGNISWAMMALKLCPTVACTDDTPTAAATNATVCAGGSITITATGYETGATFQWQKQNASTSVWENIDGETSDTYTVATAAAEHAGNYHIVATKNCARTSNTVTIAVPSAPVFGDVPSSVSIMQTLALSISTVEATDAVKYRWYKSADATWDAGDTEIGTEKNLIKAYDGETAGSTYYIFCRAQNACGITTSSAIAVNVTAYVEEDCATRGNEGEAHFGFENTGCSQGTYSETAVWTTNSRSKYLTYTAPEGKYLKTAKVTVAVSSGSKCGYAYSTDGGTTWTYAELASLSSTLTEKTINLNSLSGTINAFRISRNLQDGGGTDHGVTSGNFHLSKACFEYTDACTATTVTVSPTSKTYTIGNSWTAPTITLGPVAVASETLTYTSSDEDIATVDDDGTVNFQGRAGSVTITASYAGGEVGLTDYCASEGSYTITVSCSGDAPKIVAASTVDLSGCNSSVVLNAKEQDGTTDFTGGSYQWLRNGEEIDGATNKSYTATQAGIYTVEYTSAGGCTSVSTNSAVVTSTTTEPEVERLVPFQYYHVNKVYAESSIMRFRHLFAVKNSGKLDGKSFKLYVSRSGGAATDVTSSNAIEVWSSADGRVDTVMIDLNKLSGKYSENDELVFTCKAIDCSGNISEVYKANITMYVIGSKPTLALICSGSDKANGTRKTGELTVGGDFLTGYNKADLCQQTGKTSFDASQEWGLYTELKAEYLVTPVNGYANFYKLNYEPFDLLFLTDYPKASKSDAAATVLDDMAELVDFRPFFSFKTHMVHKSPSKWAAKGFTTSPTENKADGRLYLNIVCYAHPMFTDIKSGDDFYNDADDASQLVYKMLSGTGYENSKGMQGFEIDAAENFVTIGLTHYNGTATPNNQTGKLKWTPASGDRMLVSAAERQANLEARMILFSLNAGAHSMLTDKGELVVLKCLEYLISDAADPLTPVADCSLTFDDATGDGKWSTPGNWGPNHINIPGEFNSARIAAPVTVDIADARALELRIIESGHITIPAGSALQVTSTVRRMDGHEISPTEISDVTVGTSETGNGTLILNNNSGDTKATVWAYSKGFIEDGVKNYQYIGTPFTEVNALYNYYGSWIYSWGYDENKSKWRWIAVKNGGPMHAWTGYCISQEAPTYYETRGTLTATNTVDIVVPAGNNMVVGNSWTAPIDINALTTDDLEGLVGNIYFFNTGVDKTGEAGAAGSRYAGSTYVTVPVEAARYTGDDDHINSMQGFFVKSPEEAIADGVLHLDYDRHVRGTTRGSIIGDALHAPARRAKAAAIDEPTVLKIKVSGENYDDKLLLLEREDFTEGFDNGWDGDKWDGNESALYIYTKDEEGTENSVSAVPELEGTVIGFRAGEDEAYTLNFEYLNNDEPLYLYDIDLNTYTEIRTGVTYRFFTNDKEKHERFIITLSNGQEIGTGVEPTSDFSLKGRAKKLIIEDKMYILVNGMLYDATGKVVK